MSASVEKAALLLSELLAACRVKKDAHLVGFWFVGDASGGVTDFSLPKGFKPFATYNSGLRIKKGLSDQYTIKFDGFIYSVSFSVAPADGNDICIDGVRV